MDTLSPDSAATGGEVEYLQAPSQTSLDSSSVSAEQKTSAIPTENSFKLFFIQLWIMIRRNAILQTRYRKATLSQAFFGPILFILLLLILQQADHAEQRKSYLHPKSYPLQGVLPCWGRDEGSPCIHILYTPDTTENRQIMQTFSTNNQRRTGLSLPIENITLDVNAGPKKSLGIVPVPDAAFIYDYTLNNPNTTLFGIEFTTDPGPPINYRYQIWFNTTQTANNSDVFNLQVVAFQRGIDEAIVTVATNSSADSANPPAFNINLKEWPIVPPAQVSDGIVASVGSLFFFCAQMIIFIAVLDTISTEKEMKLIDSLVVMGLKKEAYWLAYFISYSWIIIICSLVTVVLAIACGFSEFRHTNFFVMFITFVLFGMAMCALAFFITTLCRSSRVSILVGIFIMIMGLLFESLVFSTAYVGYLWWDVKTPSAFRLVFMFLPFFNFGKIFLDMAELTVGKFDWLTQTYFPGPGFHWDDLYKPIPNEFLIAYSSDGRLPIVPQPVQSWYFLLMNIGVYLFLTWYFDKIIPDEFGRRRSPLFFLMPKYWGLKFKKGYTENLWLDRYKNAAVEKHEGEDVDVAKERVATFDPNNDVALRIGNLRKVYRHSIFVKSKLDKVAVNDLCLTLKEGKCFALLGQNGAGKSTIMNILSGLTPLTSGDALVYGHSIREDMDAIRRMMGVCPQFDILFNELTGREHIELYAAIKMVPAAEVQKLTEERLAAVHLTKVADKPAGTYSGGMKRRLSMVISTIGDPKILFMDEPTTGMDPVNRRHVWSFIENFKRNRVILLTTHSMEEADVLGDRICVMAHGRLRALGNSMQLKNKFGAGYRVSLVTHPADSDRVKEMVEARLPEAVLEDDSAGAILYEVPNSALPSLPGLMQWLEENQERSSYDPGMSLIKTWGVSQKGLEEAFLKLIRDANPHGYQGYEINETT